MKTAISGIENKGTFETRTEDHRGGGQANGKRRLLRSVGLQSELQAFLGSSDCWLLGSHALPVVELCLVRRAEPYATKISGLFRAGLRSFRGPARGPPKSPGAGTGARRDPRSAERTVRLRLSICLCAGLRPIEKGLRRKAATRHTGFPRS